MAAYRILSLDGGGSWALIEVMALQSIYGPQCRGHDVLKHFDLVAANSGGSIVLGGLLTNKTLSEILEFFLQFDARRKVFDRLPFDFDSEGKPLRSVWNQTLSFISPVGAKYRTSSKFTGLMGLLDPAGDRSLQDHHQNFVMRYGKSVHFLICAFDYDRKRAKFFRSNAHSMAGSAPVQRPSFVPVVTPPPGKDSTLAQAIHASTNAPVKYFIEPAEFDGQRYWDGAIAGYNNPVLASVVETLANRRRGVPALSDIQVLSLGTGTVSLPPHDSGDAVDSRLKQTGPTISTLLGDVGMLATSILDDPPDSATFTAHVILGQPLPDPIGPPKVWPPVSGNVVRMSPLLRPVRATPGEPWRPPEGLSVDTFLKIAELDLDVVDQADISDLVMLGDLWISGKVRNQAIRENKNFDLQVGHGTFAEACDSWKRISGL
ncbi:MAG: patatin-like phospholipase family protein [Hyphomicrobium sp.]